MRLDSIRFDSVSSTRDTFHYNSYTSCLSTPVDSPVDRVFHLDKYFERSWWSYERGEINGRDESIVKRSGKFITFSKFDRE